MLGSSLPLSLLQSMGVGLGSTSQSQEGLTRRPSLLGAPGWGETQGRIVPRRGQPTPALWCSQLGAAEPYWAVAEVRPRLREQRLRVFLGFCYERSGWVGGGSDSFINPSKKSLLLKVGLAS